MIHRLMAAMAILAVLAAGLFVPVSAEPIDNPSFQSVWARTDKPVADQWTVRTWMWGPEANSPVLTEPYVQAPTGQRQVQYFDKARMEITNPSGDPNSIWYVTNGLLVVELMTGQKQIGDSTFSPQQPASINVAGDAQDPNGPTYASFAQVRDQSPLAAGSVITQRIDRAGAISDDPSLADAGVTVALVDDVTNHGIAAPFWSFMNSAGSIWTGSEFGWSQLFQDPYFATGRPVVEPSWATVQVGGVAKDVLIQCFERRCLTFTPDNAPEWQVEAGNVGVHYYAWRYELTGETPNVAPPPAPTGTPKDATQSSQLPPAATGSNYFTTLPVGAQLPSEGECVSRVRTHSWEPRPQNDWANYSPGASIAEINGGNGTAQANYAPRVSGNYNGTTDEIIQWASCKWGIEEDVTRAIATWHSWWWQWFTSADGQSVGLMSVHTGVHTGTAPAAVTSTAFNLDYALAWHRSCYDGYFDWIPDEAAGDLWGCAALWFSGSWGDQAGRDYLEGVQLLYNEKVWWEFVP